ncbi:hypothetical protein LZL87_005426 [Fusarium oxysporum]|nr:hypothetical protein LZL87_005426 [Fusarium oxysporum]
MDHDIAATATMHPAFATTLASLSEEGAGNCTENPMLWNWNTIGTCFISKAWHIDSGGKFGITCVGAFMLVMILEFLARVSREWERHRFARSAPNSQGPYAPAAGIELAVLQPAAPQPAAPQPAAPQPAAPQPAAPQPAAPQPAAPQPAAPQPAAPQPAAPQPAAPQPAAPQPAAPQPAAPQPAAPQPAAPQPAAPQPAAPQPAAPQPAAPQPAAPQPAAPQPAAPQPAAPQPAAPQPAAPQPAAPQPAAPQPAAPQPAAPQPAAPQPADIQPVASRPASATGPNNGKDASDANNDANPIPNFCPSFVEHAFIKALLHTVQCIITYILILMAVSFNGYIIISMFIGAYVGALCFQRDPMAETRNPNAYQRAFQQPVVCCV